MTVSAGDTAVTRMVPNSMYVCVYIHTYVCRYTYVYMYVYTRICMYIYVYVCVYIRHARTHGPGIGGQLKVN